MACFASIALVPLLFFFCLLFSITISLKSSQVASINRSRTTFLETSSIGSGFFIPETPGIEIKAALTGSFSFYGVLAEEIENAVESLAKNRSKILYSFYQSEKSRWKAKAPDLYFTWFQAAALFGFTNSTKTEKFLQSKAYMRFSSLAGTFFDEIELGMYHADYNIQFHTTSGRPGYVRGFVVVSEVTLKSGRRLLIGASNPPLLVAYDTGEISQRITELLHFSRNDSSSTNVTSNDSILEI